MKTRILECALFCLNTRKPPYVAICYIRGLSCLLFALNLKDYLGLEKLELEHIPITDVILTADT